jgi:hypothetical protein
LQHHHQANTNSHPNSETTHRYTLCPSLVLQ